MSLTVTLAYFIIPILVTLLVNRIDRVAKVVGILFLICCGPNLFFWNSLGCAIGVFEFQSFCIVKDNCSLDPLVIFMKILI